MSEAMCGGGRETVRWMSLRSSGHACVAAMGFDAADRMTYRRFSLPLPDRIS